MFNLRKKAFTLVEMLIVVIIIGILASALLPKLKGAQERARDTSRKSNLTQVAVALEMYFNDAWAYPVWTCLSDVQASIVPKQIATLPSDPQKWRSTYGTVAGGCKQWDFAYTSMMRNSSVDAWAVIIANVESEWSVWNFILNDKEVTFKSGTNKFNKVSGPDLMSVTIASQQAVTGALEWGGNTMYINSSEIAEVFVCKSLKYDAATQKSRLCSTSMNVTEWVAKFLDGAVYTVFK